MSKLKLAIFFLGLSLLLVANQSRNPRQVKAATCSEQGIGCNEWTCDTYCTEKELYTGEVVTGCWQDCYCSYIEYGTNDPIYCTESCGPGYYVCNRDGGCCPIGVVEPTPNPGDPNPGDPVNTCGDGSCGSGEDCVNCPSDCGSCCGDGSCNNGESCYSCEADCGVCSIGDDCGDGICQVYEGCNVCVPDCGICPSCGDFVCNGFETCLDCESDCGVCPTNFAWWQARGGLFSAEADYGYSMRSFIPDETTCIEPNCYPYLAARDIANTDKSDGFPLIGGGVIYSEGRINPRDFNVAGLGTARTRLRETYSYFYSQYSLGFLPEDDFEYSDEDALKPAFSKEVYFHSGDMTIQSPWDVASGESFVILIDGDLNIQDPFGVEELINVEEGGFLAFIVSGDINIADTVGHSVLSSNTGNVEGVYIADGTINIETNGAMDYKFVGEGNFIGWTDVNMNRDFNDGVENTQYPTETFIYRPDFMKNVPEKMMRAQMIWQETN